jgi:hypothetical protein
MDGRDKPNRRATARFPPGSTAVPAGVGEPPEGESLSVKITTKTGRANRFLWAGTGATPFGAPSGAPKALRADGVAPGHRKHRQASCCDFCRALVVHSVSETVRAPVPQIPAGVFPRKSSANEPGETARPLLQPPHPEIPTRKYYVHIDEPWARTMERYAEFLGTPRVEPVAREPLGFVFRQHADFKPWLTQHPNPAPRRSSAANKPGNPADRVSAQAPANKENRQDEAGR